MKFDYLGIAPGNPFYTAEESTSIGCGIRYDLSHLSSFKVQYIYKDTKGLDAVNALKMQFVIGL